MFMEKDRDIIYKVLAVQPDKLVISNPVDKSCIYRKAVIRKYADKGRIYYQVERFTQKQAFHDNIDSDKLSETVFGIFPIQYKQMNIFFDNVVWDFKISKKGKLLSKKTVSNKDTPDPGIKAHNRKKNYILQEGIAIPPLVDLGIYTKDGRVVHSMYDKFRQINRFIELVDDVMKNYPVGNRFPNDKTTIKNNSDNHDINIVDFGCGKSYLTFILYYYLVKVRGMKVNMTGLDLKADVIEKCNATAKKYRYDNLHFELGDINGYKTDKPVNMVVTLHACDTATDYALYNAIRWNADIILSVPCCQHEVNAQIDSDDYSILTRYGIVKERVSALMTDAIRANVLEYCGYNTQLLEFIDIAHSPKNILIRAVRRKGARTIDADFVTGGAADYERKVSGISISDSEGKFKGADTADSDRNDMTSCTVDDEISVSTAQAPKNRRAQKAWIEAESLCEEFNIKQTLMELVRDR